MCGCVEQDKLLTHENEANHIPYGIKRKGTLIFKCTIETRPGDCQDEVEEPRRCGSCDSIVSKGLIEIERGLVG